MRNVNRILTIVIFLLVVGVGANVVIGEVVGSLGCPPVSYSPTVGFDVGWDGANETVTVRHAGGDELAPGDDHGTVALFVSITDAETGAESRITWINESAGRPPVEEGDMLRIEQSGTGSALSPGDRVRVLWRGDIGYHHPFWCFDQGVGTHLIGEQRISSETPNETS